MLGEDKLMKAIFGDSCSGVCDAYLVIVMKLEYFLKGRQFTASVFSNSPVINLSTEQVEAFLDLGIAKGFLGNIKYVGLVDNVKTYEKVDLPYMEGYRFFNKIPDRAYKTVDKFYSLPSKFSCPDVYVEQLSDIMKGLVATNSFLSSLSPLVSCSYNEEDEPTYRFSRYFHRPSIFNFDDLHKVVTTVYDFEIGRDFALSDICGDADVTYAFNSLIANNLFRKYIETGDEIICSNVVCKDFNTSGEMVYSVVKED